MYPSNPVYPAPVSFLLVGGGGYVLRPVVLLVLASDRPPPFSLLVGLATPWGSGASASNWVESIRPKKSIGPDPPRGFP